MSTKPTLGLVLTGGGARGAYQAGAVSALASFFKQDPIPFSIVTGVSAGSVSAAFLAAHAHDFKRGAADLAALWKSLRPSDVFQTDNFTLTRVGLNWLTDLSLGGWIGSGRGKSLLVTGPLRQLLDKSIDFTAIDRNIREGVLRGLALTATSYKTGTAVTFFDAEPEREGWVRSTRMGKREKITIDHVLASAAIPVFFPAVRIGNAYYGDGCVRMNTPLSPAIHLGADRVLAIGVRYFRSHDEVMEKSQEEQPHYPYLADVAGVLLNAMFLDALDSDIERMSRINQTIELIPADKRASHPQKLRDIPVLALRPSQDLGALVLELLDRFPFTVRHFLKGLGASTKTGWDLLSYLAFDAAYTGRLYELGYEDTIARRDELMGFLLGEPNLGSGHISV